ncbi:tetratricopeptide repeat protein [bacterium]|nr:tetratricopeptide repeat protein [bacterium]
MPKYYPCEKNNLCGALDKLDVNFLPRESFELECSMCNENVIINPEILKKQTHEKINDDPDTHVAIDVNSVNNLKPSQKNIKSKFIPVVSIISGLLIVVIISFLIIKVVFKSSLSKYKTLSKKQLGQEQIYYNKQKIILDISTEDSVDLKTEASDELKKTTTRSQSRVNQSLQAKRYNHSKQYSDYIKRYSKLPKNIREVYESFKIDQIKGTRELIIQYINTTPEHKYISNIILSELYSYLSYIENKPELNTFAIENLIKLNNSYPETAEWQRSMAFALYCKEDYKKAYQQALLIKDIFQNDPIVQATYAMLVYRLKNKDQGRTLLHRAYLISPKHYLVNHFYSDLLFEAKEYSKAATLYKKMVFSKNVHPEIIKKAIYAYNHENEWAALAKLYQENSNSSDDTVIKLNLAKALSRSGKSTEALRVLNDLNIEKLDNKQRYTYLFEQAYAHYINKNYLQSNRLFLEADKASPNTLINLKYIGNSYFRLGRYYNAIDYYQRAYKLEPNEALQKNIALSYYESKQYENAINEFSILLKDNQNNFIFTFYLAKAYLKLKQDKKALDYAKKALALSEKNSQIKIFIRNLEKQIASNNNLKNSKQDKKKLKE